MPEGEAVNMVTFTEVDGRTTLTLSCRSAARGNATLGGCRRLEDVCASCWRPHEYRVELIERS
jgi:hypothetical protein